MTSFQSSSQRTPSDSIGTEPPSHLGPLAPGFAHPDKGKSAWILLPGIPSVSPQPQRQSPHSNSQQASCPCPGCLQVFPQLPHPLNLPFLSLSFPPIISSGAPTLPSVLRACPHLPLREEAPAGPLFHFSLWGLVLSFIGPSSPLRNYGAQGSGGFHWYCTWVGLKLRHSVFF